MARPYDAVREAFEALHVAAAPEEWVKAAWAANFVDMEESAPVPELAPEELIPVLAALCEGLERWSPTADGGLWAMLATMGTTVQAVVAVLQLTIGASATKPEAAAYAARSYVALLRMPGSGSYGVFSPMVLRGVARVLDCWGGDAPVRAPELGSKRKAASPLQRQGGVDADGWDEELPPSAPHEALRPLLRSFVLSLREESFGCEPELAADLVKLLGRISRLGLADGLPADGSLPSRLGEHPLDGDECPVTVANVALAALAPAYPVDVFRELLSSITMRFTATVSNGAAIPALSQAVRRRATALVRGLLAESRCVKHAQLLVQHGCMRVPDRREYRSAVAESLASILFALPTAAGVRDQILSWVPKYARNQRIGYRVFALDLAVQLLHKGDDATMSAHARTFVGVLQSRCADKAPTVRTRALAALSDVFNAAAAAAETAPLRTAAASTLASPEPTPARAGANDSQLESIIAEREVQGVMRMLLRRAVDEKSSVRKAALQAIGAVLAFRSDDVAPAELKVLHQCCLDPALSVRKQAIAAFTAVLRRCQAQPGVIAAWLDAVLPLVLDREDSVSSQCVTVVGEEVLAPLLAADPAVGSILSVLDGKPDLRRYVQRICGHWERAGSLGRPLFAALLKRVAGGSGAGGWSLLVELAARRPGLLDCAAVLKAWNERELDDLATSAHMLSTLGTVVGKLPIDSAKALAVELRSLLTQFAVPVPLIPQMLGCIGQIEGSGHEFLVALLQRSAEGLTPIAFSKDATLAYDGVAVARQLFVLGECALQCPEAVVERHALLVQGLIAPDAGARTHPAAVRAHAFLALGKLCLQNADLAKVTIAAMARELETCADPAVRNNIVVVMTDLCVRHPNAIQQYLPNIAACLRDPTPLVRRQTMALLTRMLKEDYIKLRGSLFFRIMCTLVDADAGVRDLGHFCVVNLLLVKDPTLFSAHFVECFFHFNGTTDHAAYTQRGPTEPAAQLFSLSGTENEGRRHHLYSMMLTHCNELERLQITQKLVSEVLGPVAEGTAKLTDGLSAVVQDALRVLSCREIKLSARSAPDEESDARMAAAAKAKATLISKIVKKNMVENVVPTVIALKGAFERSKSSLMGNLMQFLRELMQDHKDDVTEILAADRQLGQEVLFDLQRYEDDLARAKAAQSPAPGTPGLRDPTPMNSPLLSPASFATRTPSGTPRLSLPVLRQGASRLSTVQQARTPLAAVANPRLVALRNGEAAVVRLPSPKPAPAAEQWNVASPSFKGGADAVPKRAAPDPLLDDCGAENIVAGGGKKPANGRRA